MITYQNCPVISLISGKSHPQGTLLHSPSPVAIELSVGYEAWPPNGWRHAFVIGWSKYRLGLPSTPLHYGIRWPVGIPTVSKTSVTVLLHSPEGRHLPAVWAVQRDCERVYPQGHGWISHICSPGNGRDVHWKAYIVKYRAHQIPKLQCFSSCFAVVFAQSTEARPVFCPLLGVSSGYAQPITGQVTK